MKNSEHASIDCEYLIGDDSCRALEERNMRTLREETCCNDVKDICCYSCNVRKSCEISCDLPELQKPDKEEKSQIVEKDVLIEPPPGTKCGDCRCYLKSECPRNYCRDRELWRRQDPCEQFQPSQK